MSLPHLTVCVSLCLLFSCGFPTKVENLDNIKEGMVLIPAGILNMGGDSDQASSNEFPKHKVAIESFLMDATEVTNQDFLSFVEETGYITVAERAIDWDELKLQLPPGTPKPPDSVLLPGALVFTPNNQISSYNDVGQWWRWQIGANWRHPAGPESDIDEIMDHPVVQISWEDAQAYAVSVSYTHLTLPTKA